LQKVGWNKFIFLRSISKMVRRAGMQVRLAAESGGEISLYDSPFHCCWILKFSIRNSGAVLWNCANNGVISGLVKGWKWLLDPPEKNGDDMLPQSTCILKLIYEFIHTMKPVRMRLGIREKLVFHRNYHHPKNTAGKLI
jgi:hypothetical protein